MSSGRVLDDEIFTLSETVGPAVAAASGGLASVTMQLATSIDASLAATAVRN